MADFPAIIPLADAALGPIKDKVLARARLSHGDGMTLARTADFHGLSALADFARRQRHGEKAFYTINRHINYSNVCAAGCAFCAFSRKPGEAGGWTHSLEEIFRKAEAECPPGCTELHITGGLHPDLPFQYYCDMLAGLKSRLPHLHLKAFGAAEIAHFARLAGQSVSEILLRLKAVGLGSLPGGGAEIFNETLRREIAPNKISADEYLAVHRAAHNEGLRTNATMLYGYRESWEDRIEHLARLRALQDETGGFQAFVPLAFQPGVSSKSGIQGPSGLTDLRVIAISRLLLDNVAHIKAYWVMLGVGTAQLALLFGADDLDGTVVEESIGHMAGAASPQALRAKDLERLIREAGRVPVRRDSAYSEVG